MKQYKWRDEIGELPLPPCRVLHDESNNLWMEHFINRKWVKVAKRKSIAERNNRQWVPLFSNMKIEETGDNISLMEIK